ncbi:MAG: porin family protein [Bacteroidota bacterium]
MKKYISILLLLSTVIFTYANKYQANQGDGATGLLGEKTRLGINFNPLLSWSRTPGIEADNKGVRMGFQFGLQLDYYFAKNYGLTTGLYFDYLGTNINYTLTQYDTSKPLPVLYETKTTNYLHKYTSQYIELPIGIKLRTNEFKRITVYGELGASMMVLVSARGTLINDFDGVKKDQVKVYNTRVNVFDMAASGGAGIEYNIAGKTSIVAGLVYKYAFLNHIKDDKFKNSIPATLSTASDPIYLNYLALRVGVLF